MHWRAFAKTTALNYTQALTVELLYRFPLLQSFLSVGIGFIGVGLFWAAAGRSAGASGIYTPGMLLAYFIVSSAHSILHENQLGATLSLAIRMGKLSASMLRPYPFLLTILARAAAHATVRLCLIAPLLVLMYWRLDIFSEAAAALSWTRLAYFALALWLSLLVGWLSKMAIGLLAFDMTQTWGPELIFLSILALASGVAYPADLLPGWMLQIAVWTPVYYMIGFPTLVLLGRLPQPLMILGFERGGLVLVATVLLGWAMWRRGMGKFEAVGI